MLRPGQMEAYGWRLPFFVGGALSLYALYLRRGIAETDAFRKTRMQELRGSMLALLVHWRAILLAIGIALGGTISFYTYTVYMHKFMVNTVGIAKDAASLAAAAALLCYLPLQPLFGFVSDLIGRRRVLIFFGAVGAILTVPLLNAMRRAASAQEAFALNFAVLFVLSGFTSIHMLVKSGFFPAEVRAMGGGLPYATTTAIPGGSTEWLALHLKAIGREHWFYWWAAVFSLVVYLIMPETRWKSRLSGAMGAGPDCVTSQHSLPARALAELASRHGLPVHSGGT